MIKTDTLEQFVDTRYRYDFWQGPEMVRNKQDALNRGINCISLAHLALRDLFDVELPESLHCAEMFRDRELFGPVDPGEDLRIGDLVWFGIEDPRVDPTLFELRYQNNHLINWRDNPVKHVGIYAGNNDGQETVLHSTPVTATNSMWTLDQFREVKRYRGLYGATRLIV